MVFQEREIGVAAIEEAVTAAGIVIEAPVTGIGDSNSITLCTCNTPVSQSSAC